MVLTFSTSW